MFDDEDELEAFLAEKRRTTLILHRSATPMPGDASLSYLGGLPRLPPGVAWPEVERRLEDGPGSGPIAPTFIGQIDLATLPVWRGRSKLPKSGTIYIFCNTQYTDVGDPHCKVLYSPESSSEFPEASPPANLMRIGGVYDGIIRSWIRSDREAGVEFKYTLSFEPNESPDENSLSASLAMPEEPKPNWNGAERLGSHRLLMWSWPQAPHTWQTFKDDLLAKVNRAAVGYDGQPWSGFDALLELVQALPDLPGEPFRWLDDGERQKIRRIVPEFLDQFTKRSKGAPRIYANFGLADESVLYSVSKGFADGQFTSETDSGRLITAFKNVVRGMLWPHQMLGAGASLQVAPLAHAEDTLLLQISDIDCLAFTDSSGVLQIWVPEEDLKRGHFENAVATYEC